MRRVKIILVGLVFGGMLTGPGALVVVGQAPSDTAYPVVRMALSPDGALLAATGRRYETQLGEERFPIDIIDAFTGQLVTSLDSEFPILSVSWSADSTQIVTSDSWGPVVIWTVADGSAIGLTGGGAIQVDQVQWSPVSDEVAFTLGRAIDIASANGIEHGLVDREIGGSASLFDWSPDGNRIASVGGGHLRIWDTVERPVNGNLLNRFEVDPIVALDWHPDGNRIAISTGEGLIRILDPETGQDLSVFSIGLGISGYVIVWSPTGDQIAVEMKSHEIGIWDVSTGELLKTLSIETYASALAWSPDGTRLYHNGGPEGVYVNGVPLSSGDIPPLFVPLDAKLNLSPTSTTSIEIAP